MPHAVRVGCCTKQAWPHSPRSRHLLPPTDISCYPGSLIPGVTNVGITPLRHPFQGQWHSASGDLRNGNGGIGEYSADVLAVIFVYLKWNIMPLCTINMYLFFTGYWTIAWRTLHTRSLVNRNFAWKLPGSEKYRFNKYR